MGFNIAYGNKYYKTETVTNKCTFSIGGVDGTLFQLNEYWKVDCILFKE